MKPRPVSDDGGHSGVRRARREYSRKFAAQCTAAARGHHARQAAATNISRIRAAGIGTDVTRSSTGGQHARRPAANKEKPAPTQVRAGFTVELRGFEPLTPTLPVWCATNCAIAPYIVLVDGTPTSTSDSKPQLRAPRRRTPDRADGPVCARCWTAVASRARRPR
jgi:hypothetical protein